MNSKDIKVCVIINADDFGYSKSINNAIMRSFEKDLVTSTTIMANMPAFEEACLLSKKALLNNKVGVHLNLFEGTPLTSYMRDCNVFCNDDGQFHGKKIEIYDPLKIVRKIIINELSAQIERVFNAGIKPTHLDSHAHRHTNIFIGKIVINLAKDFNIPAIRISGNLKNHKKYHKKLLCLYYNKRIERYRINKTNYLGSISDVAERFPKLSGVVEIITHPILSKNNEIFDAEFNKPLNILLSPFNEIRKISYADL